jgi:hypothetical protein
MSPNLHTVLGISARPGRVALAAVAFAALLLFAGPARAAGFTLKTSSVDEKNGEWHIKVRIDLPRAPSMMHTPMRFTFAKEAVDERAIMSKGAEPQHHRMVLDTEPKQIVSMDVDFADASGKVFKSTYFEFDLQRASGYFEAGEYVVTLSGPDGEVGVGQHLVLKGDNPPVYRGAMEFDTKASGKKGPKIEAVGNALDGGPGGDQPSDSTPSAASTEVAAVGSAAPMVPSSAYNKTEEEEAVHGHPGGCGCFVVGARTAPLGRGLAGGLGAALALLVAVRRRSR